MTLTVLTLEAWSEQVPTSFCAAKSCQGRPHTVRHDRLIGRDRSSETPFRRSLHFWGLLSLSILSWLAQICTIICVPVQALWCADANAKWSDMMIWYCILIWYMYCEVGRKCVTVHVCVPHVGRSSCKNTRALAKDELFNEWHWRWGSHRVTLSIKQLLGTSATISATWM